LEVAVRDEKQLLQIADDQAELRVPHVTMVGNRGTTEGVYNIRVTFGWYWEDRRFGTYVVTPDFGAGSNVQFRMPNSDISELLSFVREGREWLKHAPAVAIN